MGLFLKRFFIVGIILHTVLLSANDFTPIVMQFTRKDYNASNQNWAVGQGTDGAMFFGNNKGLLEFDGSLWQIHKMPEDKMVRSIFVGSDNRIYVGSFEEFGFFERDNNGQMVYTSLSDELQHYTMQNDEIWNILELNGSVIFQSFTSYFTSRNGKVTGNRCPFTFLFFNVFQQQIFTHTEQLGFSYLDSKRDTFFAVPGANLKSPVISVLKFDSRQALLVTKSDGLFLFDGTTVKRFQTEVDDELMKAEANRAVMSPNGLIIIGTILDGVTALDKQGKKLWTLNTSNVLQNNTVLGMYCDKENNLWLALDKGISLVQLNSSIRYIHSFQPSVGSVYDVNYNAPDLFLATNQGMYKTELSADRKNVQNLQLLSSIKGQVWSLDRFDNQLISGNNESTFDVSGKGVRLLSPVKGGICIKKGVISGREVLVQGTYTQLCIYEKKDGEWKFSHTVDGFLNPIRYIEIDYTGTIWASHLHQGLFAIRLTPDLKKIENIRTINTLNQVNEFPINVFSINNRVVFTDKTGFYTYDDIRKMIVPYEELNESLGYFSFAHRVCYFKDDLYWFVRDGEAALVRVKTGDIKVLDVVQYALFLNQTVDDYQNVIPVSDTECLFTLENGLALYRTDQTEKNRYSAHLQIKMVQTSDAESKEFEYLPLDSSAVSTPFRRNNISITVFYSQYSHLNNVVYRYKLEGLDKVWSEPTEFSRKEYNYLPYGEYTFRAEVMTKSGIKLSETSYSFDVEPPFYLSTVAKLIYIVLVLLFIYLIYLYIRHLFQVKKEKIHHEQDEIRKKEIEKREQQIMALEKEKLESELTIKSKELAESTMTIIKKNEILVSIKEEVIAQKKALGTQYPNKYYDKLVRLLDENLSSEDDWAIFQTNFDRIHENFFRHLHISYPELTANDLRFCAYLRLNLSSKDIAHLMNISLKGVEVGRYRIRKKIGLPSTKSLTEFMIEFK